jgi:signal transduction histidine kinase
MIRDSLDVLTVENRAITVRRVAADLSQLLDSLLKRFRPLTLDKEVQLTYVQDRDANTVVEVDPVLLWRVVLNLLVNALKFSPPGTTITLSVTAGSQPNTVRITVKDEGPGIAPEHVAGLFEKDTAIRRYRAHNTRAGYGLGLVFSRLAVEAHDGKIFVETAPGQGSSFIVELPN